MGLRRMRNLYDPGARLDRQREECDRVVAEFNGDVQAMAAELLRYRRATRQLADAPFCTVGPEPYCTAFVAW
jgi:hypothetical protein